MIHHWAVQVEDTWYEIDGLNGEKKGIKHNKIAKTIGSIAKSGAGSFGGEYVGKTNKSDREIESFNTNWVQNNPTYDAFAENCQKYAIELIRFSLNTVYVKYVIFNDMFRWLTDNCYRLLHAPDAADLRRSEVDNTIALAKNGQAFAAAHVFEVRLFDSKYQYYIFLGAQKFWSY